MKIVNVRLIPAWPCGDAMNGEFPTTADILSAIGAAGVVVGSVASGSTTAKDVDVVVRPRGNRNDNPVFAKLIKLWPQFIDSECVGHLTVLAEPLGVELFEYAGFSTGDPDKDARRLTYGQARRQSVWKKLFGVDVLMVRP